MAKNINQAKVERQYKQKMLAMTGSVSHTLNIADQAMDLAEQFMTEGELINSDAYRVLENLTCVCEDALRVLCNAISKHPEGSSSIPGDKSYQSEEASVPLTHPQTAERLEVLSSSVGIYYSWYVVFFKPALDISYVHQNLQLKPSATYLIFLERRELFFILKWCEKLALKLP